MRNLAAALLLAHGVPMVHMGDEYAHTKVAPAPVRLPGDAIPSIGFLVANPQNPKTLILTARAPEFFLPSPLCTQRATSWTVPRGGYPCRLCRIDNTILQTSPQGENANRDGVTLLVGSEQERRDVMLLEHDTSESEGNDKRWWRR